MADQFKILRPSDFLYSSLTLGGSATSTYGALRDDSDSTYIYASVFGAKAFGNLDDWVFPPGTQIKTVWPVARMSGVAISNPQPWDFDPYPYAQLYARLADGRYVTPDQAIRVGPSPPGSYGGPVANHPDNRNFLESEIQGLQWYLMNAGGDGNTVNYFEFYMYVYYNRRLVYTAQSPQGGLVLATTMTPTFKWLYGDWEQDTQEFYQIKVFSGSSEVLDPENETARLIYDSGIKTGDVSSYKLPVPLSNGQYRWAVKASDAGSGQRWGAGGRARANERNAANNVNDVTMTNGTVTRETTKIGENPASYRVTATAAGDVDLRITRLFPCEPGEKIEYFGSFQPNTTARTVLAGVEWMNASGGIISTSLQSATEGSGYWVLADGWAVAPGGATQYRVLARVQAAAAGEVHFIAAIDSYGGEPVNNISGATIPKRQWAQESFEINVTPPPVPTLIATAQQSQQRVSLVLNEGATPETDWFEIHRSIDNGVTWEPIRGGVKALIGNILTDAETSMEGVTAWEGSANTASGYPQISTAQSYESSTSMLSRAAAAALMANRTIRRITAVPGRTYKVRGRSRPGSTARGFSMGIDWLNDPVAYTYAGNNQTADVNEVVGAWTEAVGSWVAPAGTQFLQPVIRWTAPAANEDHYYDRVMVYEPTVTIYDREMPRNKPVMYRARAWRYVSISSNEAAASAWVTSAPVTVSSDGKNWFRHPTNANLDFQLRTSWDFSGMLSSKSTEEQGVFAPSGASEYVVVGSTPQGEVFDAVPLLFYNDAEWQKFEDMRKEGSPILFQSIYGGANGLEQWWVKLGTERSRVFVNRGTSDAMGIGSGVDQVRKIEIGLTQVHRPSVT